MNIQCFPDDLKIDTNCQVQVFDYYTNQSSMKNKIMLKNNVFSFLQQGTKELLTHDKGTIISNDTFLVIKSGNCLMTEKLSQTNVYHSILLFFDDTILQKILQKINLSKTIIRNSQGYQTFKYDAYINHFVKSLIQIKEYDKTLKDNLLITKLEEILTYLLYQYGDSFITNLITQQNNQNKHFIEVVESNKLNKLTVQELSFLCNMSISTFKRNFEQHYKTSPKKWFQEKRLEYAAYLLGVKNSRPIDIYATIGFENLSSFTKAFKSKYNQTPKQFQLSK